ncbi:hypothetical protein E4U37_001366 [Claviceps purpurea]|nr:hypothetical protein E4U37_001366 [Claviceps purpurea]
MSSDVRSLLRQQRAARRIDHPHAAYSDAGKLLCTLCREQLKAEALWDAHLSSQPHQERLQHHRQQRQQQQRNPGNNIESAPSGPPPPPLDEGSNARMVHKRKLASSTDAAEDADMGDDEARRKRGRPDVISLTGLEMPMDGGSSDGKQRETLTPEPMLSVGNHNSKESTMTPSGLMRKASVTPTQGVELQIPSRPATPAQAHREGAGSGTSSAGGYFNLQSQSRPQTGPSTPMSAAAAVASTSTTLREASSASSSSLAAPGANAGAGAGASSSAAAVAAAPIDETEWAAFEADIAATEVPYDQDAVISAPAMTNEEAAAAKEAQDAAEAQSRAQVDVDIEYEKEEARRALEEEFEQMKGLEERVEKLKEMRAAFLAQRSRSTRHDDGSEGQKSHLGAAAATKGEVEMLDENLPDRGEGEGEGEDEDEDEDDEEEEDDEWDLFRFRR